MNVADGEAKRLEKTSKQDNGTKKLVGIELFRKKAKKKNF